MGTLFISESAYRTTFHVDPRGTHRVCGTSLWLWSAYHKGGLRSILRRTDAIVSMRGRPFTDALSVSVERYDFVSVLYRFGLGQRINLKDCRLLG